MISKFKKNSYQWSPLAILLIIILGCVSLPDAISTKVSDSSTSQSAPPIMIRRVWADADGNLEGAPSPDGRYLSYVDWETGDLAIYEIDTGKKRRLTNKGTWEESYEFAQYSKWSPDGKKIVYNWFNENSFFELRIIDLDGTKPRILYRNEEVEYLQPCDWSPDGKQVLAGFDKKDGNQIVLVSVADGSVRVLKTVDKSYPDASFSPDGRYIVNTYRQIEELYQSNRDISLISTDGSREIPLVEHPADDFVLGWAPDGKKILFASDRTGTLGVWLIAVADEEPQGAQEMLKPDIGQLEPLGFTQKGSFYYGFSRKSDDIYVATLDQQTGKIIAPLEKAIQRYEGSNIAAAYSPDGKYLAYIRRSGTLTQHSGYILCVHSLETDKQRDFTLNFTLGPNVPRWSPNGRSLLVVGNKDNIKGLYQIDTQTGGVKLVVPQVREDGSSFNSFDWSADGESIFYVHLYKLCRILVRDLANSIEKELYRSEDDVYSPYRIAVSSDGKWLALNSQLPDEGLGSLKVIQVTGGEAQELCKFEENFGALTLSADGKYIFFARKVSDDLEELCRITTEGGEIEKLGLEMKQIQSLSVHPDGQHILVSGQESATESEVWVMENFLPEAPVAKSVMAPKFTKIQIPNRISQYSQLSYDGKSIAFVNDDKIWIMPMSSRLGPGYSGEPRLLDTGEVLVDRIDLTWSGDSKWIAFNGKQVENGCQKIYIVSADGGEPKQVHENNRHSIVLNYRMSLSPDGKTLAFSTFDGHGIYIETISVEGGLPKRLVDAPAREPVFSPDGHIIAYVENKNLGAGGGSLWTIPASGGTPTLIADANNASSPVWSPEGRMIAFIDYGAGFQIYLVPVTEDGRAAGEKFKLELPEGTEGATCLTGWTPDNKITALYAKKEEFALYTRRIENGKASFITVGGYPMQPRWSPDGKLIYHTNNLDDTSGDWERYAIAYVPSEGGDVTTIPIKSEDNITIWGYGAGNRVSPDGKTIVFAGQTVQEENLNRLNIWTIPTEGGEPEQLTSPPPGFTDWYPCWSHDGQDIVFVRQNLSDDQTWSTPEEGSIYVVSSEGGEPSRITWESDRVYSAGPVLWSPDGELLAFYSLDKDKVDGALCVIRPNGGELKVVANVESKKELAWSPDSKRIAFQGSEEGVIKIVSLEDGNLREIKVDLVDTEIYHLDWSPDGESLAFAGYSGGGTEFWIMENFIPKSVAVADE